MGRWRRPKRGLVGVATIREGGVLETDDEHVVVGTAGHVDHGKSTLVGSLVTGTPDDGDGATCSYLDVQPHEVERGCRRTSYAVYGFDEDGPVRVRNPNRKADRAEVVENADRLVSFVDTVGHEPWLRTTIRGLVGQKLDYGLRGRRRRRPDPDDPGTPRRVARDRSPDDRRDHETDAVSEERVEEVEREVERLLREVEKSPLRVARHGVDAAIEEVGERVVPIVETSAITMDGLETLDELFDRLPKTGQDAGEFRMYVDRSYSVTGVGRSPRGR